MDIKIKYYTLFSQCGIKNWLQDNTSREDARISALMTLLNARKRDSPN